MDYKNELGNWEEIILEPSGDTLPIGAITQFGGETAPTNWLFCNGQAVSRTDYAELFSAIGTTYGDGDGSTTFNVPDFIGRVPVGLDTEDTDFDTLGETGGSKELQSHNHKLTSDNATNMAAFTNGGTGYDAEQTSGSRTYANVSLTTTNTGTGNSGNLQPYSVTNFIIKAKQSIGIVGAVSEDITDTNDNAVPTCETVKDYVDGKNTYSTEETVIGTYNNKPLYRKIISGKLPTGNGTNNFTITNGVIRKYDGQVKSSYGSWFPLNIYYTSDTTYNISTFCNASRNNLYVVCDSQYNTNSDYEITIEYTKTTD